MRLRPPSGGEISKVRRFRYTPTPDDTGIDPGLHTGRRGGAAALAGVWAVRTDSALGGLCLCPMRSGAPTLPCPLPPSARYMRPKHDMHMHRPRLRRAAPRRQPRPTKAREDGGTRSACRRWGTRGREGGRSCGAPSPRGSTRTCRRRPRARGRRPCPAGTTTCTPRCPSSK